MQAPQPQRTSGLNFQPVNQQQQAAFGITQGQSYYNPAGGVLGGYNNPYLMQKKQQEEAELKKKIEQQYHNNYTNLVRKVGKAMGDCEEVIEEQIQRYDETFRVQPNEYDNKVQQNEQNMAYYNNLKEGNRDVILEHNALAQVSYQEGAKTEGVSSLLDFMVKSRDIIYSYHDEEERAKKQQQAQVQNSYNQSGFSNGIQLTNNPSGEPVNIDDMQVRLPSSTLTEDMATERRNMFLRSISNMNV